ncbi:MAG: NifU family protein [Jatrophihabitans sp.]
MVANRQPGDALVPVHPEAVTGDARALRWRTPVAVLAFVGAVEAAPDDLGRLMTDGTLESLSVEPDAVLARLGAGRDWRTEGPRFRTAVQAALGRPDGWTPGIGAGTGDDALRMAVEQVIAGEVGDYVRSHGGEISLVSVTDGHVEVNLSGACSHCPASEMTLTQRVDVAVRRLYPELRGLRAAPNVGAPTAARRLLGMAATRGR